MLEGRVCGCECVSVEVCGGGLRRTRLGERERVLVVVHHREIARVRRHSWVRVHHEPEVVEEVCLSDLV